MLHKQINYRALKGGQAMLSCSPIQDYINKLNSTKSSKWNYDEIYFNNLYFFMKLFAFFVDQLHIKERKKKNSVK